MTREQLDAALQRAADQTRDGRLAAALGRALASLAALDESRSPAGIERAVAGVRHELRTAARLFDLDPDALLARWREPVTVPRSALIEDVPLPGVDSG